MKSLAVYYNHMFDHMYHYIVGYSLDKNDEGDDVLMVVKFGDKDNSLRNITEEGPDISVEEVEMKEALDYEEFMANCRYENLIDKCRREKND